MQRKQYTSVSTEYLWSTNDDSHHNKPKANS